MSDYYPFGAAMAGRSMSSEDYRYGFNGKENDDEVKGSGNSVDFGARIYDSRVGRWWSVDPYVYKYPQLSPYHGIGNNPIFLIDKDGRENMIYLVVTPSAIAELGMMKVDMLVREAQKNIDNIMGQGVVQVKLHSGNEFEIKNMDESDLVGYLGTVEEAITFAKNQNGENTNLVGFTGNKHGNPEETENPIVALDVEDIANMAKETFNTNEVEMLGFLLIHGAGHTSPVGRGHTGRGGFLDSKSPNNIMSRGDDIKIEIDKGAMTLKDFATSKNNKELKIAFGKKFTSSKPLDNYSKNKIAKSWHLTGN